MYYIYQDDDDDNDNNDNNDNNDYNDQNDLDNPITNYLEKSSNNIIVEDINKLQDDISSDRIINKIKKNKSKSSLTIQL